MASEDELDLTSALAGGAHDSGSDDEATFLRGLVDKKAIKDGNKFIKSQKDLKNKAGVSGGGSFQSLGLSPPLLKALLIRGFTTPTPIQRQALPALLADPPRDVVGMARTGSGKTLAYLIPLISRLGARHSSTFGARALVLVPTRELALQVLKVGKDLSRGARGKDEEAKEALRWAMIVGGDSLEEQFAHMASNPDVIIATPGRLLHLLVEMSIQLKTTQYVVFDEADRLFELGFATALNEIMTRLPPSRQTLLFSATLPSSLLEFAKAGLQNPLLIRLDADSKISEDLQMAFLNVKPDEKEAALLLLLRDIIKIPQETVAELDEKKAWLDREAEREDHNGGKTPSFIKNKKRKREDKPKDLAPYQTILFAATKHHVEYLSALLASVGYSVSSIYSSLDQASRRSHLSAFRKGYTSILCVTDLAARGIDIPILQNVVNYDFPTGVRAFVHRVGRTARAGRTGWAYSFVTSRVDLPYFIDLSLFLGRPIVLAPVGNIEPNFSQTLVMGSLGRERLDQEDEHFRSVHLQPNPTLQTLKEVCVKGQKMYEKSSSKASSESYRRAKEMVKAGKGLAGTDREDDNMHPIFVSFFASEKPSNQASASSASARVDLMAAINTFKPKETVFEIGKKGKKSSAAAQLMQERRKTLDKFVGKKAAPQEEQPEEDIPDASAFAEEEADDEDIDAVFGAAKKSKSTFQDPDFYLGYSKSGADSEKGYSLNEGISSFTRDAAAASFDLGGDDENPIAVQRASMVKWDRKSKKFVKGDGVGADNRKLITTESGAKLPATYKSGTYDAWKSKQKIYMPKVGEAEIAGRRPAAHVTRFRHKDMGEKTSAKPRRDGRGGNFRDLDEQRKKKKSSSSKDMAGVKSELRSAAQIRKERMAKENRKRRSTQPSKKKKKT